LTTNWVIASGTQALNSSNGNRVTAVFGLSEDAVSAYVVSSVNAALSVSAGVGIGFNSTTVRATGSTYSDAYNNQGFYGTVTAELATIAPIGNNFWQALEAASGAGSGIYAAGSIVANEGLKFTARM
jgi:hypothetical protein